MPDLCNCCLVCAATEGEPCGRPIDSLCGESLECVRGLCACVPGPSCEHEGETEQEVILGGGLSREKKGPRLSQNRLPPQPSPMGV